MDIFYQPKHAKPNPSIKRFKNSPKWVLSEIKWYICFWKNLTLKIGNSVINSGIKFINWRDKTEDNINFYWENKPTIKNKFENFKKFCYNIYIKLRKKDIRIS